MVTSAFEIFYLGALGVVDDRFAVAGNNDAAPFAIDHHTHTRAAVFVGLEAAHLKNHGGSGIVVVGEDGVGGLGIVDVTNPAPD
jgi:hypothetical protein